MATADFTAANEIYFNGQKIDEVYLGDQKIWPIQTTIANPVDAVGVGKDGQQAMGASGHP